MTAIVFDHTGQIGPGPAETLRMLEEAALRDENERLRAALAYYAKPRTFGKGEHSIFVDDCAVAKSALRREGLSS